MTGSNGPTLAGEGRGLWDAINAKREDAREAHVRAFNELDRLGPHTPGRVMERAGRELGASVRKGNPEAVLMSAYFLVRDGEPAAARTLLRQHDALCREHGDLGYMRGEAEMRAGFTPIAAIRARAWFRLARRARVSSSVKLGPPRQSAQALILLGVGFVLVVLSGSLRMLATSWRLIGAVAGFLIAVPGLLRQLAFHRVWALVLVGLFLAGGVAALI